MYAKLLTCIYQQVSNKFYEFCQMAVAQKIGFEEDSFYYSNPF